MDTVKIGAQYIGTIHLNGAQDLGILNIGSQNIGVVQLNGSHELGVIRVGAQNLGVIKLDDSTLKTYQVIGLRFVNGSLRFTSFGLKFLR